MRASARAPDSAGEAIGARIASLEARGLIELTALGYRPSALGLRFLNDLLLEFMPESSKMTGSSALSMTLAEPGRAAPALYSQARRAPDRRMSYLRFKPPKLLNVMHRNSLINIQAKTA